MSDLYSMCVRARDKVVWHVLVTVMAFLKKKLEIRNLQDVVVHSEHSANKNGVAGFVNARGELTGSGQDNLR